MKGDKIIEVINVTKQFSPNEDPAVDNLSLDIKEGEFVTLLGPSGCGKTTTLRMLAGFEIPTSGQILLNGKDITKIPPHLRPINTVFQKYALFPHLNVFNNIAFGLKLKKIPVEKTDKNGKTITVFEALSKPEINEKVKSALKMVDLVDYEERNVDSLSGGQQQRVAIARALVNEPKVLLLDEPLGALDLKMRQDMQMELKAMHEKLGITFVYVTHDQEEALTMSDKIVVLKDGTIQQVGSPMDIYNEPQNAFVADFIGESNILSGIMLADYKIKFANETFTCVDKGFRKNEPVDVVVRPEDILVAAKGEGMIEGKVVSNIFKGIYFEMQILANGIEFLVQDTNFWKLGEIVSLTFKPNEIHIMRKTLTTNLFDGVMKSFGKVQFADATWACDMSKIEGVAKVDLEQEVLFDKNGAEISFAHKDVEISIGLNDITLTDNEVDGTIGGDIIYKIFKGDHYNYLVRTDEGYDFFLNSHDNWDDNDRVGVLVEPTGISMVFDNSEEDE